MELDQNLDQALQKAIQYALDGEAILFTGAGFSLGATNLRQTAFKTGRQFAAHLAKLVDLPEDTPLNDASEEVLLTYGADGLITEVKEEYTAQTVTDSHVQIAGIPWRRIYTTNYDDVLETASKQCSKSLTPVTLNDAIDQIPNKHDLCVHFNGYIGNLTRQTIGSEVKLTEKSYVTPVMSPDRFRELPDTRLASADYATSSIEGSPWAILFRQDLSSSRAVFFIGYSLADLDITRLVAETSELAEKCFFVIGSKPDAPTERRVKRYGTPVLLDTQAFAARVKEIAATYVPPDYREWIGYCLQQQTRPEAEPRFSDEFVFDLVERGEINVSTLWTSLHDGHRYFLERKRTDYILQKLDERTPVVVYSEIANGKTLFLEGIKFRALERGYDVYSVVHRTDKLMAEVEKVLSSERPTLIVIDDYPDWRDVIEYYHIHARSNSALLLSARSSLNDIFLDQVRSVLKRDSLAVVPIDQLQDDELDWLVNFFDEYGLWGDKAAWKPNRKKYFLVDRCRRQFHGILIELFKSPLIAERFNRILTELNQRREYYEVLVSIFALTVLHHPTTMDTLIDIWGSRVLDYRFQTNPVVRQLVDFRSGRVIIRSAAAAQFILTRVANIDLVIDALVEIATAADRASKANDAYYELLVKLMRFSEVQQMVPEQQKRQALIRYYERIKNLHKTRTNYLFWLQYAIACLVLLELERARRYFDTAYAYAHERGYDTYQIDNHYARFLLVNAIETRDAEKGMQAFKDARRIIESQLADRSRQHYYYPYRVAKYYADFFAIFASEITPAQQEEIADAADFVVKRARTLPEDRQQHQDVVRCQKAMSRILEAVRGAAEETPQPPAAKDD